MIKVERLNGTTYFINPHMIESMESLPDLTITMLSGKTIVVKNSPDDIIEKIVEYRRHIGLNVAGARRGVAQSVAGADFQGAEV